jgi:hypothetical protein
VPAEAGQAKRARLGSAAGSSLLALGRRQLGATAAGAAGAAGDAPASVLEAGAPSMSLQAFVAAVKAQLGPHSAAWTRFCELMRAASLGARDAEEAQAELRMEVLAGYPLLVCALDELVARAAREM